MGCRRRRVQRHCRVEALRRLVHRHVRQTRFRGVSAADGKKPPSTILHRSKAVFESSWSWRDGLTQNVYAVPEAVSSEDVLRNYKADLTAKGFTILFEAAQASTGPCLGETIAGTVLRTQIWA